MGQKDSQYSELISRPYECDRLHERKKYKHTGVLEQYIQCNSLMGKLNKLLDGNMIPGLFANMEI